MAEEGVPAPHLVAMDISGAFDSIDVERAVDAVNAAMRADSYLLTTHTEVSGALGSLR